MSLPRPSLHLSFRTLCAITFGVIGLAALTAAPASAQTGVIAFRDDCTGLLYAMRGDGSGRIALPLPPLPQPTNQYRYRDPWVLDVSTSGPLTVVYYVGISPMNSLDLVDFGLFAVQVNEVGGVLTVDPPERLSLPSLIAGVNPNGARNGSLSPVGFGDRLALVANSETASVLMTAQVERDSTSKIIGLSDLVVVGDLYSIGVPDPNLPASQGFTGFIDYSPDGASIVASIYFDLWRISLRTSDNTFLSAEQLTTNTDGFAEWNPAFSPDGSRVAYSAGAISTSGGVRNTDIYSLTLATRDVLRVTSNRNKGSAANVRNNAMWKPDGAWIGLTAFTSSPRPPRNTPCSNAVNSEIFLIKADGSSIATQITNTNGTSVEAWPRWGW